MKKFNVKLISLICFLVFFCSFNSFAQKEKETESTKKVVIVKKIKDKDGKVKVERIEKEGKEAEKYLKELDIKDADGQTIDLDLEIDGDEVITSDGKKKRIEIIEIDDISELSDELKKELKDLNIEVEILNDEIEEIIDIKDFGGAEMIFVEDDENIENLNINKNNDETTIDVKTKDGKKETFKYKGEMPDDVRKKLEEMGVKVGAAGHFPHRMMKTHIVTAGDHDPNKGFLGVIMGDEKSELGVKIDDVVEGSGAEKAGIKAGDIITAIDGKKVANSNDLIDALKGKKANDEVKISYIRGDDTNKVTATLGETKSMGRNLWISSDEDGNHFKHKMKMKGHHGSSFIVDEDNENIATIDVRKDNDETEVTIKEKDGKVKKYKWEGEIPDNTRKELEEMGVKVSEDGYFPHKMHTKKVMKMHGGGNKAFLGVEMGDKKSDKGVYIDKVVKDSGAEKAGLKSGDVITSIDGKKTAKFGDLVEALSEKKVGDKVAIEYLRDDKANKTEATLGESKGGATWITKSKDGEEIKIKIDNDFDFDFDFDGEKIEIEGEDGENIFMIRKAGKSETKAFLGIHMDLEDEEGEGVKLSGTSKDSGAEKAGLKKGDIVTSIDGKTVNNLKDVKNALADKKAGDKVTIKYNRDGKAQTTEATLGEKTYSKNMIFEFDEDHDFEFKFDDKKKVIKRKVIVLKKEDDDDENEVEEKIIINSGSAGNFDDQKVKVFPNPSSNQITVQFNGDDKPFTLLVQDVAGKEILREEIKDFGGNFEKQIDISNAASGMIVVTIDQGDEVYKMKVLKQ